MSYASTPLRVRMPCHTHIDIPAQTLHDPGILRLLWFVRSALRYQTHDVSQQPRRLSQLANILIGIPATLVAHMKVLRMFFFLVSRFHASSS
jgi:hypothetical protein